MEKTGRDIAVNLTPSSRRETGSDEADLWREDAMSENGSGTIAALLGRKVGMTRVYDEKGTIIPVTVVQAPVPLQVDATLAMPAEQLAGAHCFSVPG